MSCYKPNFIITRKFSQACMLSYRFEYKKKGSLGDGWKPMKDKPYLYKFLTGYDYDHVIKDYDRDTYDLLPIPCGQCVGCRLDYSRQWANRCYLEAKNWQDNYFITLTYDDDHLPVGSTGNNTLVPDDIMKFVKDLRRYWSYHYKHDNIRYFLCGEYGDSSLRPHYHLIMFNLPIFDLQNDFIYFDEEGRKIITQHVANGNIYQYSDVISKIWNKGNILIGKAEWQSMAYVARYVMKKQKGEDADVYKKLCIEPEFVRMSRMPGLGENYFKEHYNEIYENDNLVVYHDGAKSVQPPRYFDKLVDKYQLSDIDLDKIKEYRKSRSEDATFTQSVLFQSSYLDLLDHLESSKCKQVIALKKKL